MRGFRVGILLILLACSVPAYSHHSFAGAYYESDSVTLQRYGAEWASPSRLERDGVEKGTFQYGDQVSITGAPGRNDSAHQIHLKKVTRFSRGRWEWSGPQGQR
jgi:hypothetical protein